MIDYVSRAVPLGADEASGLRERLVQRRLDAGTAWLSEGDTCHEVAFVASGVLRIYSLSDGEEVTAYFARSGEMVSDYESYLTGTPARMTIDAVVPVSLVVLGRETIDWAYQALAHGERLGRVIAERLFLATHARLAAFYLESAEERRPARRRTSGAPPAGPATHDRLLRRRAAPVAQSNPEADGGDERRAELTRVHAQRG